MVHASCTQLIGTAQDAHRDHRSRLCLFLELGTRRWTVILHLHHCQHGGFVLVQFLHPHSFFIDDSQSSHMLKRISDSNDGRKFQNEICKHLHHPLRRSCHVSVANMQVQSSLKITRVKNGRGLQTLFERSWAILRQQCVNEVILPSSRSFASALSHFADPQLLCARREPR